MIKVRQIGILGGTFNPIHYGHLRMAQELADTLGLSEVRFIPSANPPHKPAPAVSAEHRAAMVKLAIESNPLFKLDKIELARTGASYTIDTLIALQEKMPEASLCLLMGSDVFRQLHTWHRWQSLLEYCHIVLVQRPNDSAGSKPLDAILQTLLQDHYTEMIEDLSQKSHGCITMQQISAQDISATQIRSLIQQQKSVRYLLPEAVIEYIDAHGLYL